MKRFEASYSLSDDGIIFLDLFARQFYFSLDFISFGKRMCLMNEFGIVGKVFSYELGILLGYLIGITRTE